MIKVRVREDFPGDIHVIYVLDVTDRGRRILRYADGHWDWTEVPEGLEAEPTMRIPEEVGRPLLDALYAAYGGPTDARALRADYDHERKRVDRLIAALIEPPAGKAETRVVSP